MEASEIFFTVCTAGHVDHGKTSVIKQLTGIDPDRLKEEKQRQMTTDLGFAHVDLKAPDNHEMTAVTSKPIFRVGFIDVPGHGKFLKNMLAGVGCLDLALLVVSSTDGVMPQTRQHAEILTLLNVKNVLTVMTKQDLATETQSAETQRSSEDLLRQLSLKNVAMIPVSCLSGFGFERLVETLREFLGQLWQERKARNELLASRPAFLPIDRVFKKAGFGYVVTGTLARGQLSQNDAVWLYPETKEGRVRRLESFGDIVSGGAPGQRLAVNLAFKEDIKLGRGDVLSTINLAGTMNMLVSLRVPYQTGECPALVGPGRNLRLYHGTAEYSARVGWTAESASEMIFAHLLVRAPIFIEPKDTFILRLGEDTLYGGIVLSKIRPRWLNRNATVLLLSMLLREEYEQAVCFIITENPAALLDYRLLSGFIPEVELTKVLKVLIDQGKLFQLGDFLILSEALQQLQEKIMSDLDVMLLELPILANEPYLSVEKFRTAKFKRIDHITFVNLLERLQSQGKTKRIGDKVYSLRLGLRQNGIRQDVVDKIQKHLDSYLCVELSELAAELAVDSKYAHLAVTELERRGYLRIVARDFVSSVNSIRHAHQVLSEIWQEKRQITPSDFRDRLGVTRKYAMPLLSFFDDQLITRRVGEGRVLLKQLI